MTSTAPTDRPGAQISRRAVLRVLALAGAGAAVAACGGGAQGSDPSGPVASDTAAAEDPGDAVSAIAPDAEVSLAVVAATFEQLTDEPNPFVFGLFTLEQDPVDDATAQVWAVPPGGGDTLGPWQASWSGPSTADADGETEMAHEHEGSGASLSTEDVFRSLYAVDAEFSTPGVYEVVVVTDDGRAGAAAVDVRDRTSSRLPAPGEQARAVPTPTVDDQLEYETLCTRTPEPCGMHDVSLGAALAAEQPIVLLFATPAFCQTAVCGPTVDVVEQVRQDGSDDGLVFIHCEIFSDAGETVGEPVAAWELPTEPWMFVIDRTGRIVRRADGPLLVLADEVRSLIDSGLQA